MLAQPKPARRSPQPRKRIRRYRLPGAVRREAKAAGGVDPDTWEAILAFYGYRCALCGGPWQEQAHAVALSRGGEHAASNVYPVCHRCNTRTWTRTEWPVRRHPYGMPADGEEE